jgi:hypothetical protein
MSNQRLADKLKAEQEELCSKFGFTSDNDRQLILNVLLRGAQIAIQNQIDDLRAERESRQDNVLFEHHSLHG